VCMLDMFPLSENELDRVLLCYRYFGSDTATLYSTMLQATTTTNVEEKEHIQILQKV
jgi:hypothetical protein